MSPIAFLAVIVMISCRLCVIAALVAYSAVSSVISVEHGRGRDNLEILSTVQSIISSQFCNFNFGGKSRAHMELMAAAQMRLHFQSFGTAAGLHDRETNARLVHAFYRSSIVHLYN